MKHAQVYHRYSWYSSSSPERQSVSCCHVSQYEHSLIVDGKKYQHFYFPASGQAVVTGVLPSFPQFLPSIFIAHRVQHSYCSSIFHRVLLTHPLALPANQLVRKKKSARIHTSMHSGGLVLTKLTYTRVEDNLLQKQPGRPDILLCT